MGENSKIEWTTHTFNPWIGCQKVSPGCDNCYAEAMMDHRYHRVEWGPHGERKRTSVANWNLPRRWAKAARGAAERPRVFCASLADWLDNQVPKAWRYDLADLIGDTPELDWLLLTKRIENFAKLSPWGVSSLPRNIWIGTTCEDQIHYNKRYPILQKIPAAVRFISYEPALGPLQYFGEPPYPDWFICGGESGGKARDMNADWARQVRSGCEYHGLAFFMKQMAKGAAIPADLLIRQFPLKPRSNPGHNPKGERPT